MQTRRDVLGEKFANFRSYLRANCPGDILPNLELEILQKDDDDIVIYIMSQSTLNPEEGAGLFISRYGIPRDMHCTIQRYFTCFEYLLQESVD